MSRQQLRHIGKRQLSRAWEQKSTEAQGMMTLLTAIVAAHGGRIVLFSRKIEETDRVAIQTFIDPDAGTVTIVGERGMVEMDEHGRLPSDPRSIRQRLANRLIR